MYGRGRQLGPAHVMEGIRNGSPEMYSKDTRNRDGIG